MASLRLVRLEVQRAAAERREAGAEDDAGIDQIGGRHHALVERALRFGDQRLDQLAAETFERRLGGREFALTGLPSFQT